MRIFSTLSPQFLFFSLLSLGIIFGAIVQYSGLVNRIKGKISFSVMSNWKGLGIIKRHNGSPTQARSQKQQEVRGNFSDLAGEYYSLTDGQKELWKSYASLLKDPQTALNVYVGANARLQKYFPDIARLVGPPSTPATPAFFKKLSITALTNGDFCVHFTKPTNSTLYAIVDYWAMPGLDSVANPKWTFGATAGCDDQKVDVPLAFPTGTIVKFRARTMDLKARVSPWSETISLIST